MDEEYLKKDEKVLNGQKLISEFAPRGEGDYTHLPWKH